MESPDTGRPTSQSELARVEERLAGLGLFAGPGDGGKPPGELVVSRLLGAGWEVQQVPVKTEGTEGTACVVVGKRAVARWGRWWGRYCCRALTSGRMELRSRGPEVCSGWFFPEGAFQVLHAGELQTSPQWLSVSSLPFHIAQ